MSNFAFCHNVFRSRDQYFFVIRRITHDSHTHENVYMIIYASGPAGCGLIDCQYRGHINVYEPFNEKTNHGLCVIYRSRSTGAVHTCYSGPTHSVSGGKRYRVMTPETENPQEVKSVCPGQPARHAALLFFSWNGLYCRKTYDATGLCLQDYICMQTDIEGSGETVRMSHVAEFYT